MMILHLSDTHLGAAPYGLTIRYRDVYEAFLEAMEVGAREHVDVVVHCGDFFDTPNPPPEAYVVAAKALRKLRDRGIEVLIIAGQHDTPRRRSISPLKTLESLGLVKYVAVDEVALWDVKGVKFVAVPHRARSSLRKVSVPRGSVLMAHLLLKETGIPQYDARVEDIPLGFKYVALGDYHKPLILRHRDGTPIAYPGSTEALRKDEYVPEGRSVLLVDLSRDEPVIQKVRLRSPRPWIIGRFSSVNEAAGSIARRASEIVSRGLKQPLVYAELLSEDASQLYATLDTLLRKGLIAYYRIEVVTRDVGAEEPTEVPEGVNLEAVVRELVEDEELARRIVELVIAPSYDTVRKFVSDLLESEELVKSLERLVSKILRPAPQRSGHGNTSPLSGGSLRGLARFFR
ncbi:MAG: hypothetical protein DRO39_02125 [Thermoprotei archaeon]|nr:MAG: hypothetical protein DRO39_02125 [Thermoprotei archaeon]